MGDWVVEGGRVYQLLADELRALKARDEALGRKNLARRERNHYAIERCARRLGPDAAPPKLLEMSPSDARLGIQLEAQMDVLRSVLKAPAAQMSAAALRKALKSLRDDTGDAWLYEDEVKTYVRARNKKIGWLLFELDEIVGPEIVPLNEWGRGGEYVPAELVDALISKSGESLMVRIAPGSRPKEPEFAPDAMQKAHERIMEERKAVERRVPKPRLSGARRRSIARALAHDRDLAARTIIEHLSTLPRDHLRSDPHIYFAWLYGRPRKCDEAHDKDHYPEVWDAMCRRIEPRASLEPYELLHLFCGQKRGRI